MEKKYFEAPYLKVVRVNNDIVTTSAPIKDGFTSTAYSPDREDFDEEGEW